MGQKKGDGRIQMLDDLTGGANYDELKRLAEDGKDNM